MSPFILLEVLIAFSLAALFTPLLIRRPLEIYRLERKKLEEMELERLADWTFSEVKEFLLQNKIPWKDLPPKFGSTPSYPLSDETLSLPGSAPQRIRRSFYLQGKGEKDGKNGSESRLLGIFISLNEKEYEYRLPAQKFFVEN